MVIPFISLLQNFHITEPPCSQPKQIEHGITDWDGRSSFAKYACYQGYHLVGPPSVECRYGSWYSDNPAVYPTCKPIGMVLFSLISIFDRKTDTAISGIVSYFGEKH